MSPGPVDIEQGAVGLDRLDQVVGVFKEIAIPFFAFPQGLLVENPFGDVAEETDHGEGFAILEFGAALAFNGYTTAILGDKNGFVAVYFFTTDQTGKDGPAFAAATRVNNIH